MGGLRFGLYVGLGSVTAFGCCEVMFRHKAEKSGMVLMDQFVKLCL